MNIFESLENLQVSEECFEDIVGLVEGILDPVVKKARSYQEVRNPIIRNTANVVRKGAEAVNRVADKIDNSKVGDAIRKNPIVANTYGKMKLRAAQKEAGDAMKARDDFKKSPEADLLRGHRVDGDPGVAGAKNIATKYRRDKALSNLKDTAQRYGLGIFDK